MPRKFKLGRHRKNEERLKSAKKQKIEEALDSCATINIKSLKHRLEAVSGGLPQGTELLLRLFMYARLSALHI